MNKEEGVFILVVLISLAYFTYWVLYAINMYNTFDYGLNSSIVAYSMFYYLHYSVSTPLQYLVYGNHIAPGQLLLYPIYYAFPYPFIPGILQDAVIAGTGILIFFIVKDILKNQKLALVMFAAYMISPGILTLDILYYYTLEPVIIPLTLLIFYFYTKQKFRPFLLFVIVFLCWYEITPFLAFSLGLGLFLFEYLYNGGRKAVLQKSQYLISIIVLSLVAIAMYHFIETALQQSYQSQNNNIPIFIHDYSFENQQLTSVNQQLNALAHLQIWTTQAPNSFGIFATIIGFGPFVLFAALPTLAFWLPWLAANVFPNGAGFGFSWPLSQYLLYGSYGTIIGSILGFSVLKKRKSTLAKALFVLKGRKYDTYINKVLIEAYIPCILTVIVIVYVYCYLLVLYPQSPVWIFLSQSASQKTYVSQISSLISDIPANAAVMTSDSAFPQLSSRRYIEIVSKLSNTTRYECCAVPYFVPQYILVDFSTPQPQPLLTTEYSYNALEFDLSEFNCTYGSSPKTPTPACYYYIYAQDGNATLYKKEA